MIGRPVGLYFFGNGRPNRDIYYLEVMHCFFCAPPTHTPSLAQPSCTSLSHLHARNPRPLLFLSTSTHVHVRRNGARTAVSMLVNFRQNETPPRWMCPKSAVKHFHFCRSLRFYLYHLSSELLFSLRYPYRTVPVPVQVPLLSPGQSLRRKSVRVSGLDQSLAVFFCLGRRYRHHLISI